MNNIVKLNPVELKKSWQKRKLLELKLQDTIGNVEEFQYMFFRDSDLNGLDSFEIISPEQYEPITSTMINASLRA